MIFERCLFSLSYRTFAQNCKNIEELVLCDCNKITNKTCIYLSNFANKLVVLDFESCTQIDDLGLAKIGYDSRYT